MMQRKELLDRLKRLDEDADLLFDDDRRYHLIIVGGSALILLECISRATHDIDALEASYEIMELLDKYDINCNVKTYMNHFPFNYEDRLKPLPIHGKKVDFYTASLEDIVVAKLYSFRYTDQTDVESPEIINRLNWSELERLATADDEAHASALNERNYADFRANYDVYVRRFRP
jgi:hypothetical protein